MERSVSLPFTKGTLVIALEITGEIDGYDGKSKMMDDIFKGIVADGLAPAIPTLNNLDRRVEVEEGVTTVEMTASLEVLNSTVDITVSANLSYRVDETLIEAYLTQLLIPDALAKATTAIAESTVEMISKAGKVTPARREPGIVDFLGGLGGMDGIEVVGIRG